ncbi:RHS repeat-associated core domain-containing protein [Pseudomonas sp. URIL14HWK12:I5]|uniref:RHS repeat-associated core domain-containing protein n=1 Tax=Pseudomonas sp. URIL14HWK12:I5 TaxID=1261630 RepID=UPI0009D7C789|nr:RHS repeat-associated core domain-containing protein [Pseudomonas sp. URIL14HWK12:I5]
MKKTPDSERALHFSAYTPYGYVVNSPPKQRLLAFNGQFRDALTGLYALGNGHRCFNPVLQRFQSADVMSPFDKGGINAYAYCGGDPINRLDPSGQSWMSLFKGIGNLFGRTRSRDRIPVPHRAPTIQERYPSQPEYSGINSRSSDGSSSSNYASLNSHSSSGSFSSNYADLNSYESVSAQGAPTLPRRAPPSSHGSSSRFSVNNPDRIPTGRNADDIGIWADHTLTVPGEEPFQGLSEITREISIAASLSAQKNGRIKSNIMRRIMRDHHPGRLYMYAQDGQILSLQQNIQRRIRRRNE